MWLKKHWWSLLYGLCLTAFTVYLALDTFVIERVYEPAAAVTTSAAEAQGTAETQGTAKAQSSAETVSSAAAQSGTSRTSSGASDTDDTNNTNNSSDTVTVTTSTSAVVTDAETLSTDTYADGNSSITLTTYRLDDTTVYVAAVTAADPSVLQTAFAKNSYGRNLKETTSAMAEEHNAVLAINGDYYGSQESGYVIRNGVLYRSTASSNQEDLVIYSDGSFGIINESEVTAEELLNNGAVQVLSFGPALVEDGEIAVSEGEEVGKAKASNPRTALGITADGTYLFVVSDGRTSESAGLSLSELASFLKELGAVTAYNLDGGGSSTMVFQGEVVNQPTTDGRKIQERSVSDIVYIASES